MMLAVTSDDYLSSSTHIPLSRKYIQMYSHTPRTHPSRPASPKHQATALPAHTALSQSAQPNVIHTKLPDLRQPHVSSEAYHLIRDPSSSYTKPESGKGDQVACFDISNCSRRLHVKGIALGKVSDVFVVWLFAVE